MLRADFPVSGWRSLWRVYGSWPWGPTLRAQRHRGVLSQQFRVVLYSFLMAVFSGCAATSQPTASVPVAVSCLPPVVPAVPATLTDSQLASLSDFEFVLRIAAERLDWISYGRQAESLLAACK